MSGVIEIADETRRRPPLLVRPKFFPPFPCLFSL